MSLRQRGQRPSEATNEGGYYTSGVGGGQGTSSYNTGGMNQQQTQNQHSPPPPNSGYQQQQQTPSTSGYQTQSTPSGGYYGSNTTPATPSTGYAAYTNNNIATPQQQQGAPSYLSQTAPPAFHHQNSNGSYGNNQGSVGINLHSAGYQRNDSSGSYGGYNSGSSTNMGASNSFSSYQKPPSNSGFTFKHILLSLFTITVIVLTGTTFYYRNVMITKQSELNLARVKLEKANAAEKRANNKGRGGGYNTYGNSNNNNKKKKKNKSHDVAAQREKLHQQIAQVKSELKAKQSDQHSDLSSQYSSTQAELESLQSTKQDLLKQIDHTQYLIEDAKEDAAKYKAMVDGIPEMEAYMKKREGGLFNRVEVLESKIGGNSRREAEEWFGPGPHHVEIELEYPKAPGNDPKADPSTWQRIRRTLTLEMAPLDQMPHTVNLFLQQVHHELWDGSRIHYNPRHIFLIGPSYHEEKLYPHYDNFYKMGLDKVSFQEYSKEYPHAQWTVGMAGRPAGPDFYINKIDNTHNHGPGGQPNEDDMHNEADPCFAKIINDGHLILQDIDLIPYKSIDNSDGSHGQRSDELMYPVTVISAKILAHEEGPVEGGYKEVMHGKKLEDDEILPLPDVPHGV